MRQLRYFAIRQFARGWVRQDSSSSTLVDGDFSIVTVVFRAAFDESEAVKASAQRRVGTRSRSGRQAYFRQLHLCLDTTALVEMARCVRRSFAMLLRLPRQQSRRSGGAI